MTRSGLVAGADQRREIPDRAQVGLCDLPIAFDLGLLDLEFREDLVRLVALGSELRPVSALVGGKLHGRVGAALRGRFLYGAVYLADAAVEVRHQIGLNGYAPLDIGSAAGDGDVAANPLLRVPGLLVVNNGRFTKDNERGIRWLSATSKAEEAGSAGRFGLGQTAVFHISDALIVVPIGHSSGFAPFIVSPFYGLEETDSQTAAWEDLTDVPDQLGRWVDDTIFTGPYLAIWLPLRRDEILLSAGQFDSWTFGQQDLLAEIMQRPILATVLSASRHLDRFEIQHDGRPLLSLIRNGAHMAEISREQDDASGSRRDRSPFNGTIRIRERERACSSSFCARRDLSRDTIFGDVKAHQDWPSEGHGDILSITKDTAILNRHRSSRAAHG